MTLQRPPSRSVGDNHLLDPVPSEQRCIECSSRSAQWLESFLILSWQEQLTRRLFSKVHRLSGPADLRVHPSTSPLETSWRTFLVELKMLPEGNNSRRVGQPNY